MATAAAEASSASGFLDWIERVGNRVPNPTIMFVYLIALVAVLSAVLSWASVSVTDEVVVPVPRDEFNQINEHLGGMYSIYDSTTGEPATLPDYILSEETFEVRNLLSVEGLRHFYSSFVDNFAGFGVVATVLIAMAGVGVAEHAGLMAALIRKVVKVSPPRWLALVLIFVGVLSSVATDAGYLILVPLAAAAFRSVGRHPLAGLAAAFAGVGAVFGANLLITPSDSMLTEITNEVLSTAGMDTIEVTQNYYFAVVSSVVLTVVVLLVTVLVTEKRLGSYAPAEAGQTTAEPEVDGEAVSRGLRFTLWALLGYLAVITLLTAPPGAPLREPETGDIIGTTPFMASLPRGRLARQRAHAPHGLPALHGDRRPALPEEGRHRHDHRPHASLRRGDPAVVDGAVRPVVLARDPVGARGTGRPAGLALRRPHPRPTEPRSPTMSAPTPTEVLSDRPLPGDGPRGHGRQ